LWWFAVGVFDDERSGSVVQIGGHYLQEVRHAGPHQSCCIALLVQATAPRSYCLNILAQASAPRCV